MDIIDRLLAHDTWTTRQLLLACQSLPDTALDQEFDIDHRSLRQTFVHIIGNMEVWTDLLDQRPVQSLQGNTLPELLVRLDRVSPDFAELTRRVVQERRADDHFLDVLDQPLRRKTFGGAIGHVLTHSMHHRAHLGVPISRACQNQCRTGLSDYPL